jgi:8-oxo-dGTP pyrophosphatase MutT (NUDIX family)
MLKFDPVEAASIRTEFSCEQKYFERPDAELTLEDRFAPKKSASRQERGDPSVNFFGKGSILQKVQPLDAPSLRLQYGALPFRWTSGSVEILLVTSRRTRRWIIPKGWPIKGLKPWKAASREAYEEAGVRGVVGDKPIGRYVYEKRLDPPGASVICAVNVFPLLVKRQCKTWPEASQRAMQWLGPVDAAGRVAEASLAALILAWAEAEEARGLGPHKS